MMIKLQPSTKAEREGLLSEIHHRPTHEGRQLWPMIDARLPIDTTAEEIKKAAKRLGLPDYIRDQYLDQLPTEKKRVNWIKKAWRPSGKVPGGKNMYAALVSSLMRKHPELSGLDAGRVITKCLDLLGTGPDEKTARAARLLGEYWAKCYWASRLDG
jgi:hypothetical protein